MRADLHVHSDASDGTDPPAEVMRRAARAGLDVVALTDHDTVAGHAEARAAAGTLMPVTLLPGMELSCQLDGRSVHLLAYLFDAGQPELAAELARIRDDRVIRARAMVDRLAGLGVDITWAQVAELAGSAVVGRPHIARAMAASGAIASPRDAFTPDWIADGGRAYVGRYALDPARAIALVRAAGGVTVLAHPRAGRDTYLSDEQIAGLAAAGLAGLEVHHPDQPATERVRLLALAHDLALVATGGSDDHGSLTGHRLGAETTAAGAFEALVAQARPAGSVSLGLVVFGIFGRPRLTGPPARGDPRMSLRCHFNANGWLTGPVSISHHLTPNRFDSGFAARARGVVQHTEDGFEAGTFATFMDPGSAVSAFFSVSEHGVARQYLPVGRGFVAWAQAAGNPNWYSIECEDKRSSATPMTDVQLTVFAQLYSALAERDGFGYAVTDDTHGGRGLITHGDGGNAWGGHPGCPGQVRRAQRPEILARARAVRDGLDIWITRGRKSLHDLARDSLGGPVGPVLKLTAEYSAGARFAPAMASYLNAVFAADSTVVPVGVTLFFPAPDGSITQVTSPGDQTLRAIARAHDTQCSSVVRATAEHSSGGTFPDDLAAYLDTVFAASAARVPAEIRLFYRKP